MQTEVEGEQEVGNEVVKTISIEIKQGGEMGETSEEGQEVQSSSYKICESWRGNL